MNIIKKLVAYSFRHPQRSKNPAVSIKKIKKPYNAREFLIENFRVVTVEKESCNQHHIVFLHGGAYVVEASSMHLKIIKILVDFGFRVSYIDYPLAPENTAIKTNEVIINAYKMLVEQYPTNIFHVFGDSAGGGLALILLMLLRDNDISPFPSKTILMSPWLDVSMDNPKIAEQDKKEILLPLDGLIYAGKMYAGDLGTKHPYVSPLYGNLENIGKILMIYSSNELFVPDCELLIEKCRELKNTHLESYKEIGMFHDYILYTGSKKSKIAFEKMASFLLS
jgi:acetyl esterase/lipase